jgi:hypothetical protein
MPEFLSSKLILQPNLSLRRILRARKLRPPHNAKLYTSSRSTGLPCLRQPIRSAAIMRRQAAITISSPASLAASSTAQVIRIRGTMSAGGILCRPHPARRQTGRSSGAGGDQVRNDRQPQNSEGARPDRATGPARSRRRGDRMTAVCRSGVRVITGGRGHVSKKFRLCSNSRRFAAPQQSQSVMIRRMLRTCG